MKSEQIATEKRLFRKMVALQFQQIGCTPKDTRKYYRDHIKLRQYAELLHQALSFKPVSEITIDNLNWAYQQLNPSGYEKELLMYVVQLCADAIEERSSQLFKGATSIKCVCGGHYIYHHCDEIYRCDRCGMKGRADIYGFPICIPAGDDVRKDRQMIHHNIGAMVTEGAVSYDDAYKLVSYFSGIPEIYCHAGLLTTSTESKRMLHGSLLAASYLGLGMEECHVCQN
ncbi:hypothetical protein [Vibrio tritonius]|uniref:hypothetical protein n=1 Tax=Vibrio tritonius TaxID=1435069 RepID=UPI00315DFF0D